MVSEVPGVLEAAVIGAPDDRFGETPMAIVYAPGVSVEEIVAHCNANLANYKAPRYVIVEDQPLPRLATGKLAKPALRSKYLADLIGLMKVR